MNNSAISTLSLNSGSKFSPVGSGAATASSESDSDDFLQLMITQLRAQTPLEPVDNESMMQQMSNFSSMEQQQALNRNLDSLIQLQTLMARLDGLNQGSSLIGRTVDFVTPQNKLESGVVSSVRIDETGQTIAKVGDEDVAMSSIVGVRATPDSKDSDEDQNDG